MHHCSDQQVLIKLFLLMKLHAIFAQEEKHTMQN